MPELKVCLTVGYVAEAEDVTFLYASFSKAYRTGLIPKTVLLDMASRSAPTGLCAECARQFPDVPVLTSFPGCPDVPITR